MGNTAQEKALQAVKTMFGRTGWTHDFIDHRRVGAKGKWAMGETWQEAIDALKAKVTPA